MQVYKISPVVKYSPFFTLTYVSKLDFVVGDVVNVEFNRRQVFGVVMEKYELKDVKVEIRKADFQTKKIEKRNEKEKFISSSLLHVCLKFSKEYFIPVGEIVCFIYGEELQVKELDLESQNKDVVYVSDDLMLKLSKKDKTKFEVLKGAEIFQRILLGSVHTLTIKNFNFDKYINFQSPHISKLDLLFMFLATLVKSANTFGLPRKIILETDFLGVVETNWLEQNVKNGLLFGKLEIEVKEEKNKAKKFLVKVGRDQNGEEEVLAKEALRLVVEGAAEGRPLKTKSNLNFFFVLSHGYADRIFCNDCGKSYDCENCGHGYSLLNAEDGRFLYCKNCKNKKVLKDDQYVICKHCGGWRVFPFGIGGQKVKEFLEINSVSNISLVDESEKRSTVKKIKDTVENFLNTESGMNPQNILIGSIRTLKVLQSLVTKKSLRSFVISTGPIIRGKFFDSDEKLMRLISEVENISSEVYINKREGDEVSLENYKDKDNFVIEELKLRISLKLPPFSKVVSLIFDFRVKKAVDKYIMQDFEKFKPANEIKKGNKYVYFWFVPCQVGETDNKSVENFWKSLRQFGDMIVANTIVENSLLGKK